MNEQYQNYEDLFERFAIMTTDGKLTDAEAIEKLKPISRPDLITRLKMFLEIENSFKEYEG